MEKVIKHTFFFSHPPERVWDYITKPELMELWLMKNNFQLNIGADSQFRTGPIASLDFDGIIYCKVLDYDPFKSLSYSWQSGPGEGKISLDSVVIWTLQAKDNGTEVVLEHRGFKNENLDIFNGLNQGWLEKFDKIAKLLNSTQDGHSSS